MAEQTLLRTRPSLAIVVPCYNETEALPETIAILTQTCAALEAQDIVSHYQLTFVDDGSGDGTWPMIQAYAAENRQVHGIRLSCNRGHQNALLCGLLTVRADVVLSIDADLQDDVSVIRDMLLAYGKGDDIVFGVRADRSSDSLFKRWTATAYYRLLRSMGANIVYNHADFRLMSRRAIEALRQYEEVNLFLRGIVSQLGFSRSVVLYDRQERKHGVSKYPLRKMLALAFEGITSFSIKPLRWITILGGLVSVISFAIGIWALCVRMLGETYISGWASTVIPMYFLGGVQLLSIGTVGEYMGKVYLETKHRPRFIISETVGTVAQAPHESRSTIT